MDGNWDALIYIALSIIIFAVSVMRKKKKPVSHLDINKGVNQKQDIFNVITGGQIYEDRLMMQTESKEIQADETEIENTGQINRTISKNEVAKETKSKPEKSDWYEEQDKSAEIEWDDFDLRQAVIYSEILNRKLF